MFLVGISDCSSKTERGYHYWQSLPMRQTRQNPTRHKTCRLSIKPYPGIADHLGPQFEFRFDELVGFGDRQLHQGAAAFLELRLEFGRSNPRLLPQAPEYLRRGAGGSEQADPGFDTEAGEPSLRHGRQMRHFGVALR